MFPFADDLLVVVAAAGPGFRLGAHDLHALGRRPEAGPQCTAGLVPRV